MLLSILRSRTDVCYWPNHAIYAPGVVIISMMSSWGTVEMLKPVLESAFDAHGWQAGIPTDSQRKIELYSACDSDPVAQQALLSHCQTTQPKHVFGNMESILPSSVLADLKKALNKWTRRFEKYSCEQTQAGRAVNGAQAKQQLKDLSTLSTTFIHVRGRHVPNASITRKCATAATCMLVAAVTQFHALGLELATERSVIHPFPGDPGWHSPV